MNFSIENIDICCELLMRVLSAFSLAIGVATYCVGWDDRCLVLSENFKNEVYWNEKNQKDAGGFSLLDYAV